MIFFHLFYLLNNTQPSKGKIIIIFCIVQPFFNKRFISHSCFIESLSQAERFGVCRGNKNERRKVTQAIVYFPDHLFMQDFVFASQIWFLFRVTPSCPCSI